MLLVRESLFTRKRRGSEQRKVEKRIKEFHNNSCMPLFLEEILCELLLLVLDEYEVQIYESQKRFLKGFSALTSRSDFEMIIFSVLSSLADA